MYCGYRSEDAIEQETFFFFSAHLISVVASRNFSVRVLILFHRFFKKIKKRERRFFLLIFAKVYKTAFWCLGLKMKKGYREFAQLRTRPNKQE